MISLYLEDLVNIRYNLEIYRSVLKLYRNGIISEEDASSNLIVIDVYDQLNDFYGYYQTVYSSFLNEWYLKNNFLFDDYEKEYLELDTFCDTDLYKKIRYTNEDTMLFPRYMKIKEELLDDEVIEKRIIEMTLDKDFTLEDFKEAYDLLYDSILDSSVCFYKDGNKLYVIILKSVDVDVCIIGEMTIQIIEKNRQFAYENLINSIKKLKKLFDNKGILKVKEYSSEV